MYRIGQTYKIQLTKGIIYTGKILEEDSHQILVLTIRGEEMILNKSEIRQSKLQDRTENGKEDNKNVQV